ncbi:MAG: NrsF family protein [Deltaproteobacteria bacterium]|nr:NrsF family protein [Deltaproteobacteria bacterium]
MSSLCSDTAEAIVTSAAMSPEMKAHARACDDCRAMGQLDHQLASLGESAGTPVSLPMNGALLALTQQTIRPARRPLVMRWLASFAPALVVAVGARVFVPRRDLHSLSHTETWGPALGVALVSLAVAALVLARGRDSLGPSRSVRALASAVNIAGFAGFSLALVTAPFWGGSILQHVECAVFALIATLALVPAAIWPLRRLEPVHPALGGALIGTSVAALVSVAQHWSCPPPSSSHVLFAHGMSFVLSVPLGALLGRRWLTP